MSRALTSHTDWQLKHAPEPVLPEGGGSSPLLGKNAPDFKLPMLYKEQEFALSETKGKVVVLDFWATWCGPCTMLMPENLRVAGEFGAEKVCFIAVNQAEDKAAVKRFIEQRGWKLDVVMDAQQQISRKYLVEALPHLVVIDPKGQVSWVAVGAASSHAEKLREAITKALSVKP
ncbi:MAG: TlpA family protein disulfide reductase [Verrucomicrobiaceae bacterium]|nr:TlpA family protein disulfide reductase [Verrucomicrobiaceae bacterium]